MTDVADKVSSSETGGKMSSAALRKIKKPIIERRRRERINDSLNQLKTLVLEAMNKDESRFSKMEKADILEMTVKHLKAVQRHQAPAQTQQSNEVPVVVSKYKAGFSECAKEVTRYLTSVDGLVPDVRNRLVNHLNNVVNTNVSRVANGEQLQTSQHPQQQNILPAQVLPNATPISSLPGLPVITTSNVQQNNNNGQNTNNIILTKNGPTAIVPQQMVQQIQLPPGVVAVMSPGSPSFPEGAQSPHTKNVIPLYVNTNGITQLAYSPPQHESNMKSESPNSSVSSFSSPKSGDEAPEQRLSPSPVYITHQTSTHSEKLIKIEPRHVNHQVAPTQDHQISACKDVWRPW